MRNGSKNQAIRTILILVCLILTRPCLGTLYYNHPSVRDENNNTIRSGSIERLNSDGTHTTIASGLNNPSGIAFDTLGNLYYGNVITSGPMQLEIFKQTPNGAITNLCQVRDTSGSVSIGLWTFNIAVGPLGDIFCNHPKILDENHNTIRSGSIEKLNFDGTHTTIVSGLDKPTGIAFDTIGNMYYGNVTTDSPKQFEIFKKAPDGIITSLGKHMDPLGTISGGWALDIAVSPSGDIYYNHPMVINSEHAIIRMGSIEILNSDGFHTTVVSGLENPNGFTFDAYGNMYYSDVITSGPEQFNIFMMSPNGTITNLGQVRDTWGRISAVGFAFDIAVPEPGTLLMLGLGGFILYRNRRRD